MNEPTNVTREGGRLAVPASLFVDGAEPPFALFDRRGRLADLGFARTVYVAPSDAEALDAYVRRHLGALMGARRVPEPARAWALHRALLDVVEHALRTLPETEALLRLQPVIEVAAMHVGTEPGVYLAEVAHSVASPATHAVATALYGLTLAVGEGIDDRESLVRIATAGVLADVWKFRTPRLVARGSDLTDAERAQLRAHPEHGATLLAQAGVRSRAVIEAVRLHHERWDGAGYPEGLRGTSIPLEARILRIADAYAALTIDRPDAPGLRGYEALLEMAQSEGEFEPRLLRSFVRSLGRALSVNERWTPVDERELRSESLGDRGAV